MPTCRFNHQTFSFEGTPVDQARCLLRKVLPLGNVSGTPATLPASLQTMVGQTCDITSAQLASYLSSHGIHTSTIGGELDQPLSRTDGSAAPATSARYFVIHDTSTLHRPGRFTPATATFPPSINTEQWSGNALSNANGMTTHVMIARTGLSATSHNYRTALGATKRENHLGNEFPGNPSALVGLFLHHELVQPRLNNTHDVDQFSPSPGFTAGQYERLALCYFAASVRAGTFLIPAFHCVLDMDIHNGHDDPQSFDLDAWGDVLGTLRTAIIGTGSGSPGPVDGGSPPPPAPLAHGIIKSPDGTANVRSGPSQGNEIVAVLSNGQGVDIFARSDIWCRIAPSQEQWVHGSLIEVSSGGGSVDIAALAPPIDTATTLVATLKEKPGNKPLRNVKILRLNSRPGFCYKAAMAIDVDGSPRAYTAGATTPPALDGPGSVDAGGFETMYIQQVEKKVNGVKRTGEGPYKNFYVSRTSLLYKGDEAHKCSNFVDAELIPYVVFPDRPDVFSGVQIGDMAYVIDTTTGRTTHAIFADTNPKVGEASLRVAQNLGRSDLNANNGEEADIFVYLIFPGTRFAPLTSVPHWPDDKIKQAADAAFAAWGGMEQVKALFP